MAISFNSTSINTIHNSKKLHIHKQWINNYILVEVVQVSGYGRTTFHPTIGTLSNILSLCSKATPKQGYAYTWCMRIYSHKPL